jgi:hypothetical protein
LLGILTIVMARAARGKTVDLPRTVNLSSGKESMRQTGFSDTAWGKSTRNYATSARKLAKVKFDTNVQEAQEFMKPIRARNRPPEGADVIDVDEEDKQACLIDNSDSGSNLGSNCKHFQFIQF